MKLFKILSLLFVSVFCLMLFPLEMQADEGSFPPPPPPLPPFMHEMRKGKRLKFREALFLSKFLLDKIGVDENRQKMIEAKVKEMGEMVRLLHKQVMKKHDELRKEFRNIVIDKQRAKKVIIEIVDLEHQIRTIIELKKLEMMLLLNVQERRNLQDFLQQQRLRFWKQFKKKPGDA